MDTGIERKKLEDEEFQLENGKKYPIFTRIDRGKINCNICDLQMPKNTKDAFKHAASLGHQLRLSDVKLATKTLFKCVKEYVLVTPTSDAISLDEDDTPPGCEELQSQSHPIREISSCLKSYCKSALIGLEYVVEVHPDRNMCCTSRSFYICLLCEKRCDNIDNILMHLKSPAHRILYLKKYFPRAQSLFLRADPCCENWSPEIIEYLEAIVSRIETIQGRLQVLSCHRTQWDIKSQHFRTKIDLGTHLRETPDLLYDDITSPFTAMKLDELTDDGRPDFSNASHLDIADKPTSPPEKDGERGTIQETITLLSDVSMSESDSEECETVNAIEALRAPSRAEDSHRTILRKKSQEMLPINVQVQSVTRSKDEWLTKIPVNQSEEDDDVTIVKEGIVQKMAKSSNVLNRLVPRSISRHRSRSPKRLQSTRSSVSRHAVSRSKSRSPKRSRSSPSSSGKAWSHHRRKTEMQYSSTDDGRSNYDSKRRGDAVKHKRRHQTSVKQRGENNKNEARVLKLVEEELNAFKETLDRKERIYKERPEEHPLYPVQWRIFWKKRSLELEKQGKNSRNHDFRREWFPVWFDQMKRLKKREITAKKSELMRKYSNNPTSTAQPNDDSDKHNSDEDKEHTSKSNSKNRKPVHFGWKKVVNETNSICDTKNGLNPEDPKIKNVSPLLQPAEVPSIVEYSHEISFEELRILHKSKEISDVGVNIPHVAKDEINDPSLLQVLRMLVALEDSLGSLGPSITTLLSRTLSAERCRPGSSSQLLQDNGTWIVDLLDTSKEKLKGLVSAGILDGVKATAALQAVENVTRFLERSLPTINFSQPVEGSTSFDVSSLTNNLQVAGMLPSLPSATTIPMVSLSIEHSNIENTEEIRPNNSTQFHAGSYPSSLKDTIIASEDDQAEIGPFDQFTGEELKILIANFRTLTASQQRALIKCLRHVEEKCMKKSSRYQSQSVSSSSSPSSSRLPKKCNTYESDSDISIISVDPRPSEIQYPSILKMTGLSSVDLKNYGIPLEEIKSTPHSATLNFTNNPGGIARLSDPRLNKFKHANQHVHIGQSLQLPQSQDGKRSTRKKSFVRHSVDIQPTSRYGNESIEAIINQQVLTLEQREDGSFCNALLDPRRNRKPQVEHPSSISELLDSLSRPNDPIIIPTSPVLSRQSQHNNLRKPLSGSSHSDSYSKTLSPLPGTDYF